MKYQKKHYSIKAVLTRNLSILIATSLISLIFFGIFSYRTGIQQIKENNISSLNVYATTLQTEMKKLEDFTKDILPSVKYELLYQQPEDTL